MIRINLLTSERQKAARRAPAFDIGKRITLACSLILVLAAGGIGWWYWSLTRDAAMVEAEIAAAQQEVARLRPIIAEVSKFEAQRQQLQQRVQLIEQLRKGQGVPVHLLDQVSRSLPDMLWLTAMKQDGADVTLEGQSMTLVALSDFVGNLGTTDFFTKPIEIVDSKVEAQTQGPETIKFTVKAQLATAPGGAGGSPGPR
ncbi:MAG: PilN domain-containing protein [Vicinamibacterales bacterium]